MQDHVSFDNLKKKKKITLKNSAAKKDLSLRDKSQGRLTASKSTLQKKQNNSIAFLSLPYVSAELAKNIFINTNSKPD